MKRPGIFSGIGLAFVAGLSSLLLGGVLETVLSPAAGLRWTLVLVQCIYVVYLLRVARPRIGTISLLALNLLFGAGLLTVPAGNHLLVIGWALSLTLSRTLLFHRSPVTAALDAAIAALGWLLFGYLVRQSGSLPVALWGFFLVQAAVALIPAHLGRREAAPAPPAADPFQHPFRQARSAIDEILRQAGGLDV